MDLKKLIEMKKGGPAMDPKQKEAKMSMLQALKAEMSGMMKEDLQHPGMKKVEIAADDKEGLAHGLDKAKEMIDHDSNSDQLGQDEADEHDVEQEGMFGVSPEMEEHAEHGDSEEPEHEGEMHDGLSTEEEALLAKLLAKKGK